MSKIPDDFLQQLREISIEEVASEYFPLKQMGAIYQTKCIHSNDNDPSLTFSHKQTHFIVLVVEQEKDQKQKDLTQYLLSCG